MGLKLTVLIVLLTKFSEGKYVVSTSIKNCTLAQPPLTYVESKLTTPEDFDITDVQKRSSIMVGYFRKYAMFEYIGCAARQKLHILFGDLKNLTAIKDPGSCFYFCGSYFGISDNECVCLPQYNDTIWETEENCTMGCDDNGIACGGNGYFALYKFNSKEPAQRANNLCLVVEPVPFFLKWYPCETDSYRILCYNESNVYPSTDYNQKDFKESANYCFKNRTRPTSYEKSNRTGLSGGQYWTGVIRSESIVTVSYQQIQSDMKIGVLKYNNKNYFELSFKNADEVTLFLCVQEQTTSTSSEGTMQTTFTTSKTFTTTAPTSTEAIIINDTTNNHKTHDAKQSSDVGIGVGISLAVVITVVVGVTVFVVIRRRKLPTPNNDLEIKNSYVREEDPNQYSDIPEIKHVNGNSPSQHSNFEGQDTYAHTYHVLEKDQTIESEINSKYHEDSNTESHYNYPDMTDFIQEKVKDQPTNDINGQYAHTYFVLEEHQKVVDSVDGTYNVTDAYKPRTGQETDNIYNKLDDKNHTTYDHLSKPVGSESKREDITLASKENALRVLKPCGEPDSVYNHVSGFEESGSYDPVNNVVFDTKGGDNVYGVPKKS